MARRTKVFLTLLISFTVIYSSVTFFFVSPSSSQAFLGFGVFSERGTLSDYVPGAGLSLSVSETLTWRLDIFNRMGVIQLVRVVVRVGNLTTSSPGGTDPDSQLPSLGMIERFVPDQDTAVIDFSWRVVSINQTSGMIFPRFQINNGTPVSSRVGTPEGRDFRIIFELWTYNPDAGEFQYGWTSGGSKYVSWLQVWFDVAA